jgi:hypothetical protein
MNFWLKHTDKDKFKLPVTPSSFEVAVSHKNTVVSIIQLGEINLLGKTGLKSISLSCFFPAQDYNFSKDDREDPEWYVNKLEKWRNSNTLIRFIISDVINIQCTIESFSWGMQDGTKDIYYTINLKEYRSISAKKRSVKKIKATTYKVKKRDTLSKIAKKYYGSSEKNYRDKIYKANKKIIKSKTNLSKIKGKKIKIPAMEIVSRN